MSPFRRSPPSHPVVFDIEELAELLVIDLRLFGREAFTKRLQTALDTVVAQKLPSERKKRMKKVSSSRHEASHDRPE